MILSSFSKKRIGPSGPFFYSSSFLILHPVFRFSFDCNDCPSVVDVPSSLVSEDWPELEECLRIFSF